MNLEDIFKLLNNKNQNELLEIIKTFLRIHSNSVFGAFKQIEYEVATIKALKLIGYLDENSDEYDYIEKLKVTKAKARMLLYQESLRSDMDIKEELKKVLQNPKIQKVENDKYLIEINNPLLMDKFRKEIRNLGFIADGTYSGSLSKISNDALAGLIDNLLEDEKIKKDIINKLRKQGFHDISFTGFINAALGKVGERVAGEVGNEIANTFGEFCEDVFSNSIEKLSKYIEIIEK